YQHCQYHSKLMGLLSIRFILSVVILTRDEFATPPAQHWPLQRRLWPATVEVTITDEFVTHFSSHPKAVAFEIAVSFGAATAVAPSHCFEYAWYKSLYTTPSGHS